MKTLIFFLLLTSTVNAQFLSEKDINTYKSYFPKFEEQSVKEFIDNPRTVWYNEIVVPKAYQQAVGPILNFKWTEHNISGDQGEAAKGHGNGGNGGADFPWKHAGGTDDSVLKVRAFLLPKNKPIVWYQDDYLQPRSHSIGRGFGDYFKQSGISWLYPKGTVFLEALALVGEKGVYIFEVRLREKTDNEWEADIYRPFPTKQDLIKRISVLYPNHQIIEQLKNTTPIQKVRRSDHTNIRGFDKVFWVDYLPEIPESMTHSLLTTTTFKSSLGLSWMENKGLKVFAPSAKQPFSIVPNNYMGAMLGNSSESCMDCHKHVGKSVNFFSLRRDWYGYIPGSDGIFSFHPIDPSTIVRNGADRPLPRINETLVRQGLLTEYDSRIHKKSDYHKIEELSHVEPVSH